MVNETAVLPPKSLSAVPTGQAGALKGALQKLEPYSLENERALLGTMILNNSAIPEVLEVVEVSNFYHPAHQLLYQLILDMFDRHTPIDLALLDAELAKRGKLSEIGGTEYLAELCESVGSAANGVYYAEVVRDRALVRNLLQTCEEIRKDATESTLDPEKLLGESERKIFEAVKKKAKKNVVSISEILNEAFHKIQDVRDRKSHILGLATNFYELDELTAGLQKSQFIVVAGRPGMGKTSFAIALADRIGLQQKKPVLFFSLEMSNEQVAQVMLCAHCRVNSLKLRRGAVSDEEFQKLLLGAGRFSSAPIFVDGSSDLSILELRSRARRCKAEHNIELILIDYLQLLHVSHQRIENRQQEIALISRSLKALAKELEVPVVALSQLNRSPEREEREPRLSDLRESGAIEQDADLVIFLHRAELVNKTDENENLCKVTVAKNRMGPISDFQLTFLKEYTRFEPKASSTVGVPTLT